MEGPGVAALKITELPHSDWRALFGGFPVVVFLGSLYATDDRAEEIEVYAVSSKLTSPEGVLIWTYTHR